MALFKTDIDTVGKVFSGLAGDMSVIGGVSNLAGQFAANNVLATAQGNAKPTNVAARTKAMQSRYGFGAMFAKPPVTGHRSPAMLFAGTAGAARAMIKGTEIVEGTEIVDNIIHPIAMQCGAIIDPPKPTAEIRQPVAQCTDINKAPLVDLLINLFGVNDIVYLFTHHFPDLAKYLPSKEIPLADYANAAVNLLTNTDNFNMLYYQLVIERDNRKTDIVKAFTKAGSLPFPIFNHLMFRLFPTITLLKMKFHWYNRTAYHDIVWDNSSYFLSVASCYRMLSKNGYLPHFIQTQLGEQTP